MKLGIVSPVVVNLPGSHSPWEVGASVEELAEIAAAADRLGFAHLTCSEHTAIPTEIAATRGGTYWDPLATLSYLAAVTTRIRLVTMVLVLGYHHPLEIVKRYGTLDRLSRGRLTLGLGVGSLAEEFELLGAQFEGRGARADEAMRALRASFGQREPVFHGDHYSYDGFVVSPTSVQASIPLWVGGRTPRSLRRAVTLGDGWVPFGLSLGEIPQLLSRHDLPPGFEVVLNAGAPLDPMGAPEAAKAQLRAVADAKATTANVYLSAQSSAHYLEQLEALAAL